MLQHGTGFSPRFDPTPQTQAHLRSLLLREGLRRWERCLELDRSRLDLDLDLLLLRLERDLSRDLSLHVLVQ